MGKKKSYNRMYNETIADHVDSRDLNPIEPVDEPAMEPEVEHVEETKAPTYVAGKVVECTSLNVREHPMRTADVLTILMAGDEIQVNVDEHLDEWYHVYTASGLDGFCMKRYIACKE